MRFKTLAFTASLALTLTDIAGVASAQEPARSAAPRTTGTTVAPTAGTTGNDRNVTVAPGATGASTIQTDSAAGGNADQPSRRVPQGGGGGGNR